MHKKQNIDEKMKRFLRKSFCRYLTHQDFWSLGNWSMCFILKNCSCKKCLKKEHDETSKHLCERLENKWNKISNKYVYIFKYILKFKFCCHYLLSFIFLSLMMIINRNFGSDKIKNSSVIFKTTKLGEEKLILVIELKKKNNL